MTVIKFESVSKKYKLYSQGGLYLRDRITHILQRFNPFNGSLPNSAANGTVPSAALSAPASKSLALGSQHVLERDFWALKNISFEIKQGESVGFIGRNGAGKSTILKLLAGVTKASSGTVEVNGRVAALIEVGAGFHPELTGRENIYLNGSILGMRKSEIEKKFDSIVAFAELQEFIDTPVKHYSSGMYVRLGFAIAAHTNPDIYLIDEVLAVGDEAFQKKCLDTLAAHKDAGKTMILVSHALNTIEEVCDRCIYVNHGELRYDGGPVRAIRRYRADVGGKSAPIESSATRVSGAGAQILDVMFRDNRGKEVTTIKTGDDLIVEISYRVTGRIENPVFGLAIYGPKGEHITGFNTRTNSVSIDAIEGEKSIFCRISNLCLKKGSYRFSAAISDYACTYTFDSQDQSYRLDVNSDDIYTAGLLRFKGEWAEDVKFNRPYQTEKRNADSPPKWAY